MPSAAPGSLFPGPSLWESGVLRRGVVLVCLLVLAGCAWRACRYAGYLAQFPYQVERREAIVQRSALALAQGRDPWGPADAPQDYNSYGPLAPLIGLALLPAEHRGIRDFRRLSLAMLALAALGIGAAAAGLSGSVLAGLAGGLAVFGTYLFGVTSTARCDSSAALFFAIPLVLVALGPAAGRARLALCALIAALAFFTKPYAAVVGPVLCLWLAGQGRWRAAFGFGLLWALLLTVLVAAAERIWPGYLETTVLLLAQAVPYSFSFFLHQNAVYLRQAVFLLLLLGVALWRFRVPRAALAWSLPALAIALLLLWLSWNPGAFLNYHFQLLQPCLVLAAAAFWRERPRRERWLELVLVCCAVLNVRFGTQFSDRFSGMDLGSWRKAEAMVAAARKPLVPMLLTSVVTAQAKPVFDNGNTAYLRYALRGPSATAIRQGAEAWTKSWDAALEQRTVDLVLDDPDNPLPPQLLAGYVRSGRICLSEPVSLGSPTACFDVYRPAPLRALSKRRKPA